MAFDKTSSKGYWFMIRDKIISQMGKLAKTYINLNEMSNVININKTILKVTLNRLTKQKRIFKLGYGFYTLDPAKVDYEQLACEIKHSSYISLEYVLSIYGILDQVPASMTLVTMSRTKNYAFQNMQIEYSHIKKNLFFGYKILKNILMAYPEKALLDELYLIALGKRKLNIQELRLNNINKKKLKLWAKFYPSSVSKLIDSLDK